MIEVKSKFDANLTKPLLRLQLRNLWVLFILFPLFFVLIGVVFIVGPEPDIVFGATIIAFGTLFLPLVYLLSIFFQRIINKSMKIMNTETTNYFRFDENKIYQEMIRGDEYKATSESSYKMLHKAYETKSHFFMYISNMQTHVIPKKDIVSGTPQELANIFSAALGKKFKVLKIK